MIARSALKTNALRSFSRLYSEKIGQSSMGSNAPPPQPSAEAQVKDVPGLSNSVIAPASQPVGPGVDPNKTGAYKVPEYYCYNDMSFFEAEVEMFKYRLPQPSSLK